MTDIAPDSPAPGSADVVLGPEIGHVVVVGGTLAEWASFGSAAWERRIAVLRDGVSASGARWVTLFPVAAGSGASGPDADRVRIWAGLESVAGVEAVADRNWRLVQRDTSSPVSVVVDVNHDGRHRFADIVEAMRVGGVAVDEASLTTQLMAPCPREPDLVVVLGPPDTLPTSLVWELAYSELVFLDLGWGALEAGHLEMAVDDFRRRHRRFGGLDS